MTNLNKLEKEIISKLERLEFLTYYDVKLNDVLEWLRCIHRAGILIDGYGNFWDLDTEDDYKVSHTDLFWDLSSVSLKDQSKELIDYLASLI